MSDPVPLACLFDGYATPMLEPGLEENNDGTATWRVICPVCNMQTPPLRSMTLACNMWNRRGATYVSWQASAAAFVATVPTMSALAAWIVANPPVAD